jgi:hypothetical protein
VHERLLTTGIAGDKSAGVFGMDDGSCAAFVEGLDTLAGVPGAFLPGHHARKSVGVWERHAPALRQHMFDGASCSHESRYWRRANALA